MTAEPGRRDPLEPAVPPVARVVVVGLAVLAFLAVALPLIAVFYRMEAGSQPLSPVTSRPPTAFPAPRLETSIDPRSYPAPGPGPAPPTTPASPAPDQAALRQAMAAIAAKGAHAYDPLGSAPAESDGGAQ